MKQNSEDKNELHPIIRYSTGGGFTVHNIRLHDFIVHNISSNQLTSYISLSLSWSLASPPNSYTGTTIYGITHTK